MNENKLVESTPQCPVVYLMVLSRPHRPNDANDECQDGYEGNNICEESEAT
jgi:hypothetical protein